MTLLLFLVIAAVATVARVILTAAPGAGEIPWRTLAVNTAGAFALGVVLSSVWIEHDLLVGVAGLGSLTTFSTVASETASLLDHGRRRRAASYVALTLILGVTAAYAGISLGVNSTTHGLVP